MLYDIFVPIPSKSQPEKEITFLAIERQLKSIYAIRFTAKINDNNNSRLIVPI